MRKMREWNKLDNAAKIFPSASSEDDTQVFRFSCELYEPVKQSILQEALEKTMEEFPVYKSILKRGLFWYYLEASRIKPVVKQEYRPPCRPIFDRNRKNLLFEVTYYQNRINLEVYHVLSDGTGALQFLRTMVLNYLSVRYRDALGQMPLSLDYDASGTQKSDDSFQKYYSGDKKKKKRRAPIAYRLKGAKTPENRIRVIEGILPVKKLLAKAHDYGTTLTVLLAAVFLMSIYEEMPVRARKRPVILAVPADLRKYFHSETARNFFSIINAGYDFKRQAASLEAVICHLKEAFAKELTLDNLANRINTYASIEHNFFARITPLAVKDFFMRQAYKLTAKQTTAALSNVGKIAMPEQISGYIRLFDVFVSTNKVQICMCSYQDNLTVSFTSLFMNTNIQKNFFRTLSGMGIPVEIRANQIDEDEAE